GESSSASYRLQPGFLSPPDFDADGVRNFLDNCTHDANADQRDSNLDGYGNVCDTDLNNDGVTNTVDLGLLRLSFFTADDDADFNGDGTVNVIDLGIMRQRFFASPGPSGTAP
ncbi:MAG: thrombospondin type 3 repeat-containing protein, partial [Pseudomonadota bacterium]